MPLALSPLPSTFRYVYAHRQAIVLLLALCIPILGAELSTCSGFTKGTLVTVNASVSLSTLGQVGEADLLERFSRALIHRQPLSLERQVFPGSSSTMFASVGVGSLSVRRYSAGLQSNVSAFGNVSIDILGCGLESGLVNETLALTAQLAIGGASIRWSTATIQPDALRSGTVKQEIPAVPATFFPKREIVAQYESSFSRATIWRTGEELQLMLNDIVMSDTRDERIYHEMLVVPPLLVAEQVDRVLIIGGGEGAVLREVLKDDRVKHVTMVEIDEGLVDLCKAHLGVMHEGSFDSSKLEMRFEDGARFVHLAPDTEYDVVIVDGIDFASGNAASYGNSLFSTPFYRDVYRILRVGGVLAQYMSAVEDMSPLFRIGFSDVQKLGVDIPSFYGSGARFMLAAKEHSEQVKDRLRRSVSEARTDKRWTYFSAEALTLGLNHSARCLKGYNPDLAGAADMDETGYICMFSFIGLYFVVCIVAIMLYRRMCCFKHCRACCHSEHHPVVQGKMGSDPERLEVCIPPNCGPGTVLRVLHPEEITKHFHMTIPHGAHPGKVLQVHPVHHQKEFEAADKYHHDDDFGVTKSRETVLKSSTAHLGSDCIFAVKGSLQERTFDSKQPASVVREDTGSF
mmetsp:Transcript_425/g.655  ORF Transcript_425/g.655 Transcript_425/m.655 type:complete len:628 (+) Transcript_425:61-1944(+)